MKDHDKNKQQLIKELRLLRKEVAKLRKAETNGKRVEEVLRENVGSFRLLFYNNPLPMWVYDLETLAFLAVNDAAIQHYGYTREEFLSMTIKDIRPQKDIPALLENISKVTTGLDVAGTWRHRKKDGAIIDVEIISHTLTFAGRCAEVVAAKDVTERMRAQEALLMSEKRYKRLLESVTDYGYSVKVENGRPVATSHGPSCVAVTGYTLQAYEADPNLWYRMIHEEDREAVTEQAARLLSGEAASPIEHRIIHKDGSIRWVKNTAVPRYDEQGNLIAYDGLVYDITERKQAEEALRTSEDKYRTLVESSLQGTMIYQDNRIVFANLAVAEILGYTVEELISLTPKEVKDLIHSEDRAFCFGRDRDRFAGKAEPSRYEFRTIRKDGTVRWVEIFSNVIEYGGKSAIQTHIVDITERKRTEEALRESEAHYRAIVEDQTELIYRYLPDGMLTFVNEAYCRYFGKKRKELIGKSFMRFIPKKDREKAEKHIASLNQKNPVGTMEHRVITRTGDIRWQQRTDRAIFGQSGDLVEFQSVGRDITDRKRVEEALSQSEERYRTFVEQASDGIFISDSQGYYIEANTNGCKMLGYSREEILSMNIIDLLSSEDLTTDPPNLNELKRGKTIVKERRLKRKDGPLLSVEISAKMLPDGCLLGIVRDITERKRLEEELARAQRLETAGRVAGQIAHDFNNLLSPLTAYPDLMRDDLAANHPALDMLDEMESAAKKIAEINEQLLALGRRGHYTMEPIDLNDLVHKVVLAQGLPKEIVVREEFDSDLFLIKGGAAQLTRTLTNLINNAIEAMQDIGVLTIKTKSIYLDKPIIGYRTIERGEYVKLEISDTGMGIGPENLDKIFDPFFTTKKMDRMRGSGLGLSVVNGVMQDHNGYITVESTIGQGTTFSLYFSVIIDPECKIAETIRKTKGGNERILVVDDDPVQRRVASLILKRLGYKVHVVSSGEKAVTYVKKHPQDLLVLDMVMEGIDGADTYQKILDFQPGQKAIILSGYAMSHRILEAQRLGAGSFVSKPVTLNVLAMAIRKELEKKRKRGRTSKHN